MSEWYPLLQILQTFHISHLIFCCVVWMLSVLYLLCAGLLTLSGVSLYIVYCYLALAETERLVGQEGLADIHMSFGWSLGLAWLSYGLELLTGVLLLIAARMVKPPNSSPTAPGSFYIKYEKWTVMNRRGGSAKAQSRTCSLYRLLKMSYKSVF